MGGWRGHRLFVVVRRRWARGAVDGGAGGGRGGLPGTSLCLHQHFHGSAADRLIPLLTAPVAASAAEGRPSPPLSVQVEAAQVKLSR